MVSDTDTPKVLYTLEYFHKGTDRTVPFGSLWLPDQYSNVPYSLLMVRWVWSDASTRPMT